MKSLLFFAGLLACSGAFAQEDPFIDSLRRDLSGQKTDTGKLKTLSELVFAYANNNTTVAMQYAEQQKVLADKVNIPLFTANAQNDLAIVQYYRGEHAAALANNKAAFAIRAKAGNKSLIISSLNKLAIIYQEVGKFDTAADYQFRILRMADELKDERVQGMTYNNLSFLYDKLKNYPESKKMAEAAIAIAIKLKDTGQIARSYGNLANVFEHTLKYDSAIDYYRQTVSMLTAVNDIGGLATAYNDLGYLYRKNNNSIAGLAAYRKAFELANEMENRTDAAFYEANIGIVLLETGSPAEAYQRFNSAKAVALPDKNLEILKTVYRGLSNYYFLQKNADSGLHYQQLHQDVIDTMYSATNARQINELQTAYGTEKKEKEIQLQRITISRNRILLGVAGFILFAGMVIGYLFYNRNKLQQAARLRDEVIRQQELATRAVIEAEENERKRIARDLHDGVGQMMSAAKMNLSALGESGALQGDEKAAVDKAIALVDESCKEVRAVSHNMMPNALIKSGLASAVRAFIDQIENPALKVQLYTEGLNETLDKNTETVLYRVLQESVNNVIKHARATNLDISLIKDETGISATIEDNGRGFDSTDTSKFSGIGLDNMMKRVSFLKGTIEWQSSPGAGTLVAIYVPSATI